MCVCVCVFMCVCVCVSETNREREMVKKFAFLFLTFAGRQRRQAPSFYAVMIQHFLWRERKKERERKREREREREIERKGNKEVNIHSAQPKCVFLQWVRHIVITVNVIIRLMLSLLQCQRRVNKSHYKIPQLV